MDLGYTPAEKAFRAEVRAWLETHVPAEPLPDFDSTREGFEAHRAWERTLHAGGWGMVTWPERYGGRGLDLIQWLIFEEEYYRAGAPLRVGQNGIYLLGPTLIEYGTEAQKMRFLPAMAAGDEIWAQAWSEPGAGSDLAAVRSVAVLNGDHYVLSGHKMWSSRAVHADWAFGLFRAPGSERHKGLSLILFPLRLEGVTVRPIRRLDGKPVFAEIFLDEVKVPAENCIGGAGEGWAVCMSTAAFERGLMLRSPARFQVAAARLVGLYRSSGGGDPVLGEAVMRAWMDADAYALSIYATASRLRAGGTTGPETSTNKIFWSELDLQLHRTALSLLGAEAELTAAAPDASPDIDLWFEHYVFALGGPIYAGTNEIQRNIVAERMLGLPRG